MVAMVLCVKQRFCACLALMAVVAGLFPSMGIRLNHQCPLAPVQQIAVTHIDDGKPVVTYRSPRPGERGFLPCCCAQKAKSASFIFATVFHFDFAAHRFTWAGQGALPREVVRIWPPAVSETDCNYTPKLQPPRLS